MRIQYTCKFCKRIGWADCECTEEEAKSIGMNLELWKTMISCDKCVDFYMAKRRLFYKIVGVAGNLMLARRGNNKQAQDAEGLARSVFVDLTKRYVAIVSAHYGRSNNWDLELVNGMMGEPEKAGAYLNFTFNSMRTGKWQ